MWIVYRLLANDLQKNILFSLKNNTINFRMSSATNWIIALRGKVIFISTFAAGWLLRKKTLSILGYFTIFILIIPRKLDLTLQAN